MVSVGHIESICAPINWLQNNWTVFFSDWISHASCIWFSSSKAISIEIAIVESVFMLIVDIDDFSATISTVTMLGNTWSLVQEFPFDNGLTPARASVVYYGPIRSISLVVADIEYRTILSHTCPWIVATLGAGTHYLAKLLSLSNWTKVNIYKPRNAQ